MDGSREVELGRELGRPGAHRNSSALQAGPPARGVVRPALGLPCALYALRALAPQGFQGQGASRALACLDGRALIQS